MQPYPLSPTKGTIPPDRIVGRATELAQLKTLLIAQSVTIEEFRRMGKTLLLQKLAYLSVVNSEPNHVIYFMLEGMTDITELTDLLLDTLRREERMGRLKVAWEGVKKLYNAIKPEEVEISNVTFKLPEFKQKWKESLTACIEDLAARTRQHDDHILTLVLDELPVVLWNWMEQKKAQEAIDLLDLLRRLRINLREQGRIRFVFCGSVGMQVVLDRLRREHRYTGEPLNDVAYFRLEPMTDDDALFLCRCLTLSGFTCSGDATVLYRQLCQFADNLPFYINQLFQIIQVQHRAEISEATVKAATSRLLNDTSYDGELAQLYDRIGIYYEPVKAGLMRSVLNHVARQPGAVSEEALRQDLPAANDPALPDALETLRKEQYLVRDAESETRQYQFKYDLIKTWWKRNKA